MPPLHPIVIHFPIALFIVFSLFDVSLFIYLIFDSERRHSFKRKDSKLSPASEIILAFSIVGAWVAVGTGLFLKDAKSAFLPHSLINLHEILAIIFSAFITLLAFFRFRRFWRPSLGYTFFLLIGVALLFLVGHTGGSMVWQPAGASLLSSKVTTATKQLSKPKTNENHTKSGATKKDHKNTKSKQTSESQQRTPSKQDPAKTKPKSQPSSKKRQVTQLNQQEYATGRKVFRQSCSRCHGLNVSTDRVGVYNTDQWKAVVQNMQNKAGGTIPDTKAIAYYLAHLQKHQH